MLFLIHVFRIPIVKITSLCHKIRKWFCITDKISDFKNHIKKFMIIRMLIKIDQNQKTGTLVLKQSHTEKLASSLTWLFCNIKNYRNK